MEAEHYSEQEFVSGNYGTRTCPRTEWEFVTSPKDHVTYPGEHTETHPHPHPHPHPPTHTDTHRHTLTHSHARTHAHTYAHTYALTHTHKHTHTGEQRGRCLHGRVRKYLHHLMQVNQKFTCFTGTKVQIMTLTRLPPPDTAA
jgi:hypothetical protein